MEAKYDGALRGTIHAAYFLFMFPYRLLPVPLVRCGSESAPRSIVQTGDILNTERNAARVLFGGRKGQRKGCKPMADFVEGRGTSELAAQARQDVVLFLVDGKSDEVDAFAKRANLGCLESRDNGMVINMDLVPQSELAELLRTIHLQLSELLGRRLPVECCESLVRMTDGNYQICPRFYNLIAEYKIGDVGILGNIVIAKSSVQLKEWQRKKLKAEGFEEKSRSKIPIGL